MISKPCAHCPSPPVLMDGIYLGRTQDDDCLCINQICQLSVIRRRTSWGRHENCIRSRLRRVVYKSPLATGKEEDVGGDASRWRMPVTSVSHASSYRHLQKIMHRAFHQPELSRATFPHTFSANKNQHFNKTLYLFNLFNFCVSVFIAIDICGIKNNHKMCVSGT